MAVRITHTKISGKTYTGADPDRVGGQHWDADHTIADLTIPGSLTLSGAYALTITLSGTTSLTFPTTGTVPTTSNKLSDFAATTSAELKTVISDETGSGALVFATSPTLVTPALGTPASGVATNLTGLPISTGLTGAGTGVLAALAVNVGSTGAPVLFNGALGTPSSGTLTNATGLPVSTGISGLGTNVAAFLATPSSANLRAALTDETGGGAAVFADSPALTSTPTAPTAAVDTNTTQLATTAFVLAQAASATPLVAKSTAVVGTSTRFARGDHVHPGREVLSGARTYYVRSDGSDSNTGLTNSSGGAFLTIQAAINATANLDLGGFNVQITVVGLGSTYAGFSVTGPFVGKGTVLVYGDPTTPSNVHISTTGSSILVSDGGRVSLGGLKITTASGGSSIVAQNGSVVAIDYAMEYGSTATSHLNAAGYSVITVSANYTISGGGAAHFYAVQGRINAAGRTITLTGTPAFGGGFAYATTQSYLELHSNTFSGSATGVRYNSDLNSVIYTAGGGATYFPGNTSGATATGGQYV